jgi:hypothetical protein
MDPEEVREKMAEIRGRMAGVLAERKPPNRLTARELGKEYVWLESLDGLNPRQLEKEHKRLQGRLLKLRSQLGNTRDRSKAEKLGRKIELTEWAVYNVQDRLPKDRMEQIYELERWKD